MDFIDSAAPAPVLQQKCAGCDDREQALQRSPEVRLPGPGGGTVMPEDVQARMETAFGMDFSPVRIHEGSHARAIGALAYTRGTDIHFAPGQYQPRSRHGQELLGHELAHVVQQAQGRVQATAQTRGVHINDQESLEREADQQGRLAAQGGLARSGAVAGTSGAAAMPLQRKLTSFPEGLSEDELKKSGSTQMKKRPGGSGTAAIQMHSAAGPVVQMRGGATVGRLCVVSNVVSAGLTAGHAWLSYTPTGGAETTYGTWGNRTPIGLHRDLEVGRAAAARRCTDVDATDVAALGTFSAANNAWSYTNNCASFAARGWLAVTGEHVAYTTWGIPNPSALGAGIKAKGGTLGAGAGGGSSASSGSSYGSSSLSSVGPGSSTSSGS